MSIRRALSILRIMLILLSSLASSALLYAAEELPAVRFTVHEFIIKGENPLSNELAQSIVAPFLGDHEGLEGILEAAAELESAILQAGHSFHRVILPPQTVDQGQIQLEVITFKLAKITTSGNQHFSEKNIIASLPGLKSGTVPDTKELSRELIVANEHPSKQVTIRMKHSTVANSLDAELTVKDQRPWQFFTGLNNIGTDETGEYRVTGGYQHTNLLGRDDSFTLSYTTSPGHFSDVKQYGANYRFPLYALSGSLSFYYSKSDVDSGTIEQVFDVSGAGKFSGGSYTHTFRNRNNYRHRLSLGIDDKSFENNIDFQGVPLGVNVRSRPLTLTYSGEWRMERASVNFQMNYVRNLNGGNRNNGATYAAARLGASQTWEALRFLSSGNVSLPKGWLLKGIFSGQYTNEPLISGEQFGLGGANSVRGFEERAVTGDRGVRFSLEAWTPPLKYNVRLLGFLDAGYTKTVDVPIGQIDDDTIASIGLGLRWQWNGKLSVNIDYGHEVNAASVANAGGVKSHLSVFYRF
jgi:hemolysin activation/secretion protein